GCGGDGGLAPADVAGFVALLGSLSAALCGAAGAEAVGGIGWSMDSLPAAGDVSPVALWEMLATRILPLYGSGGGAGGLWSKGDGLESDGGYNGGYSSSCYGSVVRTALRPFLLPSCLHRVEPHLPALRHIFLRYCGSGDNSAGRGGCDGSSNPAGPVRTSSPVFAASVARMDAKAFLELCRTFGIVPTLLVADAAAEVYGAIAMDAIGVSDDGSGGNFWEISAVDGTPDAKMASAGLTFDGHLLLAAGGGGGRAVISFPQFLDCLFVCAAAAFEDDGRPNRGNGDGEYAAAQFGLLLRTMDPDRNIFVHLTDGCDRSGKNGGNAGGATMSGGHEPGGSAV
ncbi:unnamed protein product, partial [Phaeothamnion confervicola]